MTGAAAFEVTGPGVERTVESDGAALSLAIHYATRRDAPDGAAWYVRGVDGPRYLIEREIGGVVTVTPARGERS